MVVMILRIQQFSQSVYSNVVNAMTAKGAKVLWQIYLMLTALPFLLLFNAPHQY
jgi:hypothetical protein